MYAYVMYLFVEHAACSIRLTPCKPQTRLGVVDSVVCHLQRRRHLALRLVRLVTLILSEKGIEIKPFWKSSSPKVLFNLASKVNAV